MPGYRGLIALARNSGQVISINAQAVHRNDRFDYAYGLNERLEHVPAAGDRGEITHFYAYAKLKNGGHCFEVVSKSEVDAVRDRSESYQAYRAGRVEETAWVTGYAEMGKQTVLWRIAELLPLPVQKAAVLADLHEEPAAVAAPAPQPASTLAPPRETSVEPEPELDPELEQILLAFPPHILRILDAIVVYGVPEGALPGIIGMPLAEVPKESEEEILRALARWEPEPLDP